MRLIDAEQVKRYALTEGFYCDTDADKEATAEEIDQLFPTVEAIPVEWIEKYMAEELTTGSIMWQCIKDFVEDWEKENE